MHTHTKKCWSPDIIASVDKANNADDIQGTTVKGALDPQSITATFERKGKGNVTFSH